MAWWINFSSVPPGCTAVGVYTETDWVIDVPAAAALVFAAPADAHEPVPSLHAKDDDWLLSLAGPLGCAGAILALANVEPEGCAAAFTGDAGAQRSLAAAHLAARERFPRGLKELVAKRFDTSVAARA